MGSAAHESREGVEFSPESDTRMWCGVVLVVCFFRFEDLLWRCLPRALTAALINYPPQSASTTKTTMTALIRYYF